MSKDKDDIVHTYDGIEECDNDLPTWWLAIFYGSMIFSVIYVIYYHLGGPGLSQEQVLALELERAQSELLARKVASPPAENEEETLLVLAKNPASVESGKKVFDARCAACHGALGQGLVGPNLTDDFWIHGGKIVEIKNIVLKGVPAKGMLAWESLMTPDEINNVVAYIWTLHGTNPPGAKQPEGERVERGT